LYYYCALTLNQADTYNTEKFDEFVDVNDVYTSFLFNLLEESASIMNTAEDLQVAEAAGLWVTFYSELATLIYLIMDFESATAIKNPTFIEEPAEAIEFLTSEEVTFQTEVKKGLLL